MASGGIDRQAIERTARDIQREFDRHPVHVPVSAGAGGAGSGRTPGAVGTVIDSVAEVVLDWMYARPDHTHTFVTVEKLAEGHEDHPLLPLVHEHGVLAVNGLAAQDLVQRLDAFGPADEMPFILTDAGRHAAALQAQRRRDSRLRTTAAREAVLAWAYDRQDEAPLDVRNMVTSPHGWFLADRFTDEELAGAVEHLARIGLVAGEPHAMQLADHGAQAFERHGSLAEHQKATEATGVSVYFTGDNNGQLAIGNRDVQQNQTGGGDAKVLEVYARGLREFASLLSQGGERDDLEQVASSLEREAAKPEPDQGWTRSLIDRARSLLGSTKELNNLAQVTRLGLEVYNTAHGG